MYKTIMLMLLAATAATPVAAQSWQGRGGDRQEARSEARRGSNDRAAITARINENRGNAQQTQAVRNRPAPAPVRAQPAPAPVQRGSWNGNRPEINRGDQAQRRNAQPQSRASENRRENWQKSIDQQRNQANAQRERERREQAERNQRRWDNDRNWRDNNRDRRDNDRRWDNDRRDNDRRWADNRRDNDRWNRDWRNDRRYDWQDYRNHNRQLYRMPRYNPPRGYAYGYQRWAPGYRMDSWYYSQNYWISDPWYYRLPPAYGDYRWVRYYDDALLVDIRNGEIVDVIRSFFW